jgi:hypothetical protein
MTLGALIVLGIGLWWTVGVGRAPAEHDEAGTADAALRGDAPIDPRARANDPEVRAIADALRERIRRARERREAREGPPRAPETETGGGGGEEVPPSEVATGEATHVPAANTTRGDPPRGSMDPQYIQDAVRAIQPLIAECYELALHEDQTLEGRLVVEFDIEGEPDAGGVVEGTSINEDSTLHHPTLEECVRETLYVLELPAPEGGGFVHVRYPFGFSNEESE